MNKAELIDAMAAESGLTKADSKKALDAFVKVTQNALKSGCTENGNRIADKTLGKEEIDRRIPP